MKSFREHLTFYWHFLRGGDWYAGCETRKTWPSKPYLWAGALYYDGYHAAIHLGPLYVSISY